MSAALAQAITQVEQAEAELLAAVAHLRDCKAYLQAREVPRYTAHLLASRGHLLQAQETFDQLSKEHATRANSNFGELVEAP